MIDSPFFKVQPDGSVDIGAMNVKPVTKQDFPRLRRPFAVWLFVAFALGTNAAAKDSGATSGRKAARNLPDIDATEPDAVDIEHETNIFHNAAVANLSANIGLAPGWDAGLSVLNAQFASTASPAASFQPDILVNLEKHWTAENVQVIAGMQNGLGIAASGNAFMNLAYLEYQRHLPDWDVDIDTGLYYANAALANHDSAGLHLNVELPVSGELRFDADYWSGFNALGGTTFRLLYPLYRNWRVGLGVQCPTLDAGDPVVGILGVYWR
ncbi:hypothetical protein HC024_13575 [Methylococcaceae bacterium WWC4]|nr:hypothetical protein [Methylococcaceae bacterium WWC4]